jgi:hypothetical protein
MAGKKPTPDTAGLMNQRDRLFASFRAEVKEVSLTRSNFMARLICLKKQAQLKRECLV